jgi:hypothetical protein
MNERSEQGQEARPDQRGKRTYEPPEIRSQGIFETTALACGKKPGGGSPACKASPKNS